MATKLNPFTGRLQLEPSGGGGGGDVTGPGSSTTNAIARFADTSGKIIENSLVLISDTGQVQAPNGTAMAPTYSFTGALDCGMLTDGTNTYLAGAGFATISAGFNVSLSGGITSITQGVVLSSAQAKNSSFTCVYGDYEYAITTSGGAITATLMNSPIPGQVLIFKDTSGNAGTNAITISGVTSGVNIDGATTKTINSNYGAIELYFNGTQWNVTAQYTVGGASFPLQGTNGSASAPTYSFSAATNTGMYRSGTSLAWSVAGVGYLTLNSSGTLTNFGSSSCSNTTQSATFAGGYTSGAGNLSDFGSYTTYAFTDLSAPRTMTLSNSGTQGRFVWIQDQSGNCSPTNNITVSVSGGVKTINGASTAVIQTAYGGAKLYYDGTNYFGQIY